MKAIIKRAFESVGHITDIKNTLKTLQLFVGGHIEGWRSDTMTKDVLILCDEDGKLKGLPYNCEIDGETFVGTILVVGVDGEDFTDVPLTLAEWERWIQ